VSDHQTPARAGDRPAARTRPRQAPAPEALLIDLQEAGRLLSLSVRTVKRMAADGALPGLVRIRRRVLVDRTKLSNWITAGCPERTPPRSGKRKSG
jgi:excisionase family DNA binding protein